MSKPKTTKTCFNCGNDLPSLECAACPHCGLSEESVSEIAPPQVHCSHCGRDSKRHSRTWPCPYCRLSEASHYGV